MKIRQQTDRPRVTQSPEALDTQIRLVQQRIELRRSRTKTNVHQIKERTKKTLGSPFALIGAALFGVALSRSRKISVSGLLQTLNLVLLIFSRLSVLSKARERSRPPDNTK
jgi:hypothetical protein